MALTGSAFSTKEAQQVITSDNGDHDLFAHYVLKEDALRAAVEGEFIMALCGKVWVPTRNPEAYPVCPTCLEIVEKLEYV
jgi:hypothetical protein